MLRWGRHSRVYVNGTRIARLKDLEVSDEATDHKLEPRELSHALHLSGGKDCLASFQLIPSDDPSYELLEEAYDEHAFDLTVVLVVDGRGANSPAIEYAGCVLRFRTRYPEDGPAVTDVLLAPSAATAADMPHRITWTNPD